MSLRLKMIHSAKLILPAKLILNPIHIGKYFIWTLKTDRKKSNNVSWTLFLTTGHLIKSIKKAKGVNILQERML